MRSTVKYHFFLSYTNRELELQELKPLLDEIGSTFRSLGLLEAPFFWDRLKLAPDTDVVELNRKLTTALDESVCMLALVSPSYTTSPWCIFEWGAMSAIRLKRSLERPLTKAYLWKPIADAEHFIRQAEIVDASVDIGRLREMQPQPWKIRNPAGEAIYHMEKTKLDRILADALEFITTCQEDLERSQDVRLQPDAPALRRMVESLAKGHSLR